MTCNYSKRVNLKLQNKLRWYFKWALIERSSLHLVFGLLHGRPLQMKKGSLTETMLSNIFQEFSMSNKEIWVLLEKSFRIKVLPILAASRGQKLPSEINPFILPLLSHTTTKSSKIFLESTIFQLYVIRLEDFNILVLEKKDGVLIDLYLRISYLRR